MILTSFWHQSSNDPIVHLSLSVLAKPGALVSSLVPLLKPLDRADCPVIPRQPLAVAIILAFLSHALVRLVVFHEARPRLICSWEPPVDGHRGDFNLDGLLLLLLRNGLLDGLLDVLRDVLDGLRDRDLRAGWEGGTRV